MIGYATVDGRRVAISRKRSSYLLDGVDLLLFQRLTRGHIPNAQTFIKEGRWSPRRRSTRSTRTTSDIAAGHDRPAAEARARAWTRACRPTARATSSGAASSRAARHPHAILTKGVLNNWNNKPARGFPAADDQWAYGSINRVDLLNDNTARVKRHTLATLTGAMNAAATQDVRVDRVRAGAGRGC